MRNNSQECERVILVGNPNAGKSTLFNKLARGNAKVGNWHGVTVGVLEKRIKLNNKPYLLCDLPGIYSAGGMSMEEKAALSYLSAYPSAYLLFVCECGSLLKALPLFNALRKDRPCALILTKSRRFRKSGGKLDAERLSRELQIPVLEAEGKSARTLRKETESILKIRPSCVSFSKPGEESFSPSPQKFSKADLLCSGWVCIPLFLGILLACFYLTFAPGMPGDFFKNKIEEFFCETLCGVVQKVSSPLLRSFLSDGIFKSVGSVLCFLPQIALLFFTLIVLEESGLLSRLAYLTDGIFSKVGLTGRAMFSLLMGFGCSAAAIMTTRGLDDKRVQRRVILCLPYISCSAKLPVYLTLAASFFENPFFAVVLLYVLGAGISLFTAVFFKEEAPPFVMELAPLQVPRPEMVLKSLYFQIKQFIIKLGTVILAFFLASWLLSSLNWRLELCAVEESMLASVCGGLKFLFAPIGMNDWKIAYAALSGLIAKENVAGAISMFYGGFPYSAESAFAFSVFILACSPCVSAIAASARELGAKAALINAFLQTVSALLLSYLVYGLLKFGGAVCLLFAIPLCAALFIGKNSFEKIRRKRGKLAQKLHG